MIATAYVSNRMPFTDLPYVGETFLGLLLLSHGGYLVLRPARPMMPPARPSRRNKGDWLQRACDLSLAVSRSAIASAIGWCVAAS